MISEGIDGSIRDRIERFGALPVRLRPLARRQVEALLSAGLRNCSTLRRQGQFLRTALSLSGVDAE